MPHTYLPVRGAQHYICGCAGHLVALLEKMHSRTFSLILSCNARDNKKMEIMVTGHMQKAVDDDTAGLTCIGSGNALPESAPALHLR